MQLVSLIALIPALSFVTGSALPDHDKLAKDGQPISKRTTLIGFNNYNEPNCQGEATDHQPQTEGICHTISTQSVNVYEVHGSCLCKSSNN